MSTRPSSRAVVAPSPRLAPTAVNLAFTSTPEAVGLAPSLRYCPAAGPKTSVLVMNASAVAAVPTSTVRSEIEPASEKVVIRSTMHRLICAPVGRVTRSTVSVSAAAVSSEKSTRTRASWV